MRLPYITSKLRLMLISAIATTFNLAILNGEKVESIFKANYQSLEKNSETEYQVAKNQSNSLAIDTEGLCKTKAKNVTDFAKAKLNVSFEPDIQNCFESSNVQSDVISTIEIAPMIMLKFEFTYHVKA